MLDTITPRTLNTLIPKPRLPPGTEFVSYHNRDPALQNSLLRILRLSEELRTKRLLSNLIFRFSRFKNFLTELFDQPGLLISLLLHLIPSLDGFQRCGVVRKPNYRPTVR